MKHRVIFTFQPVVVEVDTFSGDDVAEEVARGKLRAQIAEGSVPIWMVDCSQATVLPPKDE